MGHRELPRSGRGCFGAVVAVPLAVVGLGGVLALVLLQGEQPGEQAGGRPVQTTSRATLVSAHRPEVAVVPVSSGASGPEAPAGEREEAPAAVRSGQRPPTAAPAPGAPTAEPSTVEERRRGGEPPTHRHRPTPSAPPPPSTAAPTSPAAPLTTVPDSPAAPPTTVPDSTPVAPAPTESVDPVTPEPTPAPVPPSSAPVPAPESTPAG